MTGPDDAGRIRRRRRLLAWSALPMLAALAFAALVGQRTWSTRQGVDALSEAMFRPGQVDEAVTWFERSERFNVYDREQPAFNRGVAEFRAGDLAQAHAEFERAFDLARGDDRCRVLVNLALTVEARGREVAEDLPDDAQGWYAEARGLATGNPTCLALTTPAGDGPGDRLARLVERLEQDLPEVPDEMLQPEADPATAPEPDDGFDQLNRMLDENAEKRSQGRELEDTAVVPRSSHDGPRW